MGNSNKPEGRMLSETAPPEERTIEGLIEQVRYLRRVIRHLRAEVKQHRGAHAETLRVAGKSAPMVTEEVIRTSKGVIRQRYIYLQSPDAPRDQPVTTTWIASGIAVDYYKGEVFGVEIID